MGDFGSAFRYSTGPALHPPARQALETIFLSAQQFLLTSYTSLTYTRLMTTNISVSATGRYSLCYSHVPGARPLVQSRHDTLREARRAAALIRRQRPDLTYPDVRIDRADGSVVEYAGPTR